MSDAPSYSQLAGLYGDEYLSLWAGLQACPECGGDGGGETLPTCLHDTGRWIECIHCGGTGSVDTEPAGIEHTEQ